MSVPFMVLVILMKVYSEWCTSHKIKHLKGYAYTLSVSLVTCIAVTVLSGLAINSIPEWRELNEWCYNVSQPLLDYQLDDFEQNRSRYAEYGISANDFDMIRLRMTNADPSFFSKELSHELLENFSQKYRIIQDRDLGRAVGRASHFIKKSHFAWLVVAALLFGLLFFTKKTKLIILLDIMCGMAFILLFVLLQRLPDRVAFGVFMWMLTVLLICMDEQDTERIVGCKLFGCIENSKVIIPAAYAIVLIMAIVGGKHYAHRAAPDDRAVYEQIVSDRDRFYVTQGIKQHECIGNLLLSSEYYDQLNHTSTSVFDIAPYTRLQYDRYGIENIYKDAPDSEVIRFMVTDEYAAVIETYIREHYDEHARLICDSYIGKYPVYRAVTGK